MPKNKGKGGKGYRKGKKGGGDPISRDLIYKQEGQVYSLINKMLGNGRMLCKCDDGKERLIIIPGKLRKRVWMSPGDLILVGLRDYQDDKGDALHLYDKNEVNKLIKYGELPDIFADMFNNNVENNSEDEVIFDEDCEVNDNIKEDINLDDI